MIRLYEDGTIVKAANSPGGHPKGGAAIGKIEKQYRLTAGKRRLIRSSAVRLWLNSHSKRLLFCTLTFPGVISSKDANKVLSNYLDNLKTNYKLKDYVCTRELHKSGVPHYHCIFDIPWTDFKLLNKAWASAYRNYFNGALNSFRTDRNPIVRDVKIVAAYISKYISKAAQEDYPEDLSARCYFISDGALSQPGRICENTLIYLTTKFEYSVYVGDYFTIYFCKGVACKPENYAMKARGRPDTSSNDDIKPPDLFPGEGFKQTNHWD